MVRTLRFLSFALAAISLTVFGLTAGQTTQAAEVDIVVPLNGLEEVPPVFGPGFGIARLTLDDVSGRLEYSIAVSGISPDQVTAAHIHRGAFGVNGPIIHTLAASGFTTTSGTVQLSAADMVDLRAGALYINVHSVTNPGGFARGQIFLDPLDSLGAALNQGYQAFNAANTDLLLGRMTDNGIEAIFGFESRAEAEEGLQDFFGGPEFNIRDIRLVSLSGETAVVDVDLEFGAMLQRVRETMVLDAGAWKLHDEEELPVPIPSGVTAVDLDTPEFAFVFNEGATASGNFAFAIDNVGRQPHEVVLVSVPANLDLSQALAGDGPPPPGVNFLAQVGPFGPGEELNMVFSRPLSAGRYALLCFIEDPGTGLPHVALGMVADFNVGPGAGGGTGTIRPPSTGDGGLLDAGSALIPALAAVSALVFATGFVGLTLAARKA